MTNAKRMTMRLIDADALAEKKFQERECNGLGEGPAYRQGWNDAIDAIMDNEPSAQPDLIRRSEVIEAIDGIDWYHQDVSKEMVLGAANENEAWYKAEDIYRALENVLSAQSEEGREA